MFYTYKKLNHALNHGLFVKELHRTLTFKQKALFKPDINMNSDLNKKQKI